MTNQYQTLSSQVTLIDCSKQEAAHIALFLTLVNQLRCLLCTKPRHAQLVIQDMAHQYTSGSSTLEAEDHCS